MIYLIIIVGLILRLINLNQSFWLDEAAQLVMSQKPLTWIWFNRGADFHPPLFYFLTHYWLQISHSEFILRLLPVLFGVLTIPATYLLTSRLFSKKIAIYSSLFVAINPYLVYYSQEMRSYSLMLFLSIASMYFLVSRQWLWFIFVNTLLLYTHYSSVLLLLTQFIFIFFYSKKYFNTSVICYLLSVILFLPWLPQFYRQLHSGLNIDQYLPGWRAELSLPFLKSLPLILFKFVAGRIDLLPNIVYLIYILFVFICIFLFLYLAKKYHSLLTLWLVLPIFGSLILNIYLPQTQPFRLIYCLPPLLIYFSLAAEKYPKIVFTLLVYIFFVGNFMQITRVRLQREQWRQSVSYLNSQNLPVIVKFYDAYAPLYWYKLRVPFQTAYPDFTTPNFPHFFLMEYLTDLTDPNRNIDSKIKQLGYSEISAHDFSGVGIIREYAANSISR